MGRSESQRQSQAKAEQQAAQEAMPEVTWGQPSSGPAADYLARFITASEWWAGSFPGRSENRRKAQRERRVAAGEAWEACVLACPMPTLPPKVALWWNEYGCAALYGGVPASWRAETEIASASQG